MTSFRTLAALAALALTAACAQPAPVPAPVVVDPYAGTQDGARYQGKVTQGTLPGPTAEDFKAKAGDTVLFAQDQTTLSDTARATVARQAAWLKKNGSFSTVVEGHSDEQGTREFNLALGARRAGAVQEYLIARGVGANRIRTVSFGKERPAATCSDESCFAQNRRAVTVVQPGAGT